MQKKHWIILFIVIVVIIIIVLILSFRTEAETTDNKPKANCSSWNSNQVSALQQQLNDLGCRDYEGKTLIVDGICGPRTNSALKSCVEGGTLNLNIS